MSKGNKNDSGKPSISLIPKPALWGMAKALTYGAGKYGRYNFRKGIEYSRLADACYRHLSAFMEGEDIDVESGNNHIDHALASLAMLRTMIEDNPDMDDRYVSKSREDGKLIAEKITAEFEKELRKVENGY